MVSFGPNVDPEGLVLEVWDPTNSIKRSKLEAFLLQWSITPEEDLEISVVLLDSQDNLVATGSLAGSIIKCVAIDERYQGYGIMGRLVTWLVQEAYRRDRHELKVFTRPHNIELFSSLGFRLLASFEDKAALLESGLGGIEPYLKRFDFTAEAALVMNCNPFTLGHRHLIEKASRENKSVVVFVLEEERSLFPFAVRLDLVRRGVADLANVTVVPSGPYILSSATFPSYFLRQSEKARAQAGLDAALFAGKIAPALGIKRRYVGEEPYCETTRHYNVAMREVFAKAGLDLIEIPRAQSDSQAISASTVRACIRENNFQPLERLVPKTTLEFLLSPEASPIIRHIQQSHSPH